MNTLKHPELLHVADQVWLASAHFPDVERRANTADTEHATAMPSWRAREYLAGRGLLRQLLTHVAPTAADAAVIPGPHGKPELDEYPELGISISHDNGIVAAAVARGRSVGVDLQQPGAHAPLTLARRCLHNRYEEFAALPTSEAATELAWVWTVQEACVKATGQGLAGRPWAIDVPLGAQAGAWNGHRWHSLRDHSSIPLSCAFTTHDAATAKR